MLPPGVLPCSLCLFRSEAYILFHGLYHGMRHDKRMNHFHRLKKKAEKEDQRAGRHRGANVGGFRRLSRSASSFMKIGQRGYMPSRKSRAFSYKGSEDEDVFKKGDPNKGSIVTESASACRYCSS